MISRRLGSEAEEAFDFYGARHPDGVQNNELALLASGFGSEDIQESDTLLMYVLKLASSLTSAEGFREQR
jgi:hypothetical protein